MALKVALKGRSADLKIRSEESKGKRKCEGVEPEQ